MLQKYTAQEQAPYDDGGQFLTPAYFIDLLKRRLLYFVIPFVLILGIGSAIVMALPAIYASEGKILVESQQIPSELVRPTVTAMANERIQVIEQRIMTRDNLLAIANKYQMFTGRRQRMSGTERIDFIRERAQIKPLALRLPQRRDAVTIAFTVGFEHENPTIAMRVANEFVTKILSEDVRVRTSFAAETTRFLEREVRRLETELGSVEAKIAELKKKQAGNASDGTAERQLAVLRNELIIRAASLSDSHPDMKTLKQRIEALEKTIVAPKEVEQGLEALARQEEAIQKNLQTTTQKLSQARLGESLERGQQSERLEIIEQPTVPAKPIRPNRPKFLAIVFAVALMTGGGLVAMLEMLQSTIHRSTDLLRVADGQLIVSIPYLTTKAELSRRKKKIALGIILTLLAIAGVVVAAVYVLPPLDILLNDVMVSLGI